MYHYSEADRQMIAVARKRNKDKRAEKRLYALELRAAGKSAEEEVALLDPHREKAEKGRIVEVSEIKSSYEQAVGHRTCGSQIYYVLRWHGWRKVMPRSKYPKKASEEVIETSKKLKKKVMELQAEIHKRRGDSGKVRLMFQDEAGFGRINKPKYCWCGKGTCPSVPCHHIREYRYAYGAVEPLMGESCFLIMPYCNTVCMNLFLRELSNQFPDDILLLCCDGATWHKSKMLDIPENIVLFYIPPYTPEMNPIEQIWKEIRKLGFKNGSSVECVGGRFAENQP